MIILSILFCQQKLIPLERQVLEAVSEALEPMAREIFNKQIEQINFVQRHAGGKEVNLYVMRHGKPVYNEELLFPLRREVQLANVVLVEGWAELWLVEGWVFSINFDKSPKSCLYRNIKVEKVKILHNPMVATIADIASEAKNGQEVIAAIHSKLPEDYFSVAGVDKGGTIKNWDIFCVQDIRKIVQRDGEYYLLAEKKGMGAIGVKKGEFSGQLYYLDYGNDRSEIITVSLRKFFEEFDGGKVVGRF